MTHNPESKEVRILAKQIKKSSEDLESITSLTPEIKERIRHINALVVQIFLDFKDIKDHNILPWIKCLVSKFNLAGELCEFEVLIEAYTIAIQRTKEGYVINNLPYWFKGTVLNIVRGIARKREKEVKKQDSIKSDLSGSHEHDKAISSEDKLNDELQSLLQALNTLSKADRYILNLRIVKGLTWSDIAEKMIQEGREESVDMKKLLARLRQRHSRALDKLRKNHQELIKQF